jgi:TatD DNase family protein
VDAVLERARAAGVNGVVSIASDLDDALAAIALAARHADVWCTVGVHPHAAGRPFDAARLRELAGRPRVVALGETGLDYHYDRAPRDVQRRALRAHAALAAETGLPLVVHSRSAEADTAAAIREAAGRVEGVLHCFSGDRSLLDTALEAGWSISWAGVVTFARFAAADLVRAVPLDRLLIETDGPYLAPAPRRGRRNEPALLVHTCAAVAAHRGETADAVARATERNARRLFAIDGAG